jgi:hypothetical protein
MAGGVLICCRGRIYVRYGQRAIEATSLHGSPEHTFLQRDGSLESWDEFFGMAKHNVTMKIPNCVFQYHHDFNAAKYMFSAL